MIESLRTDRDLWEISRILFVITVVMSAIYGAVMGGTNLFQGADMLLWQKLVLIVISAIKAPVLFLLTLFIVLPPVYVSNTFMGARHNFRVIVAEMLAAMAVTATVLASMATVALFFALTSKTYDFIKLLHVLFFAYAGVVGLDSLFHHVKAIAASRARTTPMKLLIIWLLLYALVGTQLAWILRPFVSSPNEPFQVFRPREGNFYESVAHSLNRLIND